MRIGPLLQYFCSRCEKVLKESSVLELEIGQVKEECPSCGASLNDNLQKRRISSGSSQEQQVATGIYRKPVKHSPADLKTAYRQIKDSTSRLAIDIPEVDTLLNLNIHGSLCIIGDHKYTQLLIDRLCVHTLLPYRHGGIGLNHCKIIVIDAGNCTDVYQVVNFARQYGLDINQVLQNMVVSRVFTIYQLAHLINYQLPKIIEQFSSEKDCLIAIYGLLHLFISDPHIDKADAKQLIKEIAGSISKISESKFVLVSITHSNSEYEKLLFPVFDNVIGITNDFENRKVLRAQVCNRNQNIGGKGFLPTKSTKISDQELLLVPLR
jgi:Rad51